MKDVIILGAAYFAREVYSMVQDCIADGAEWRFKGFIDDRKNLLDDFPHEGEMLGGVENYKSSLSDIVIPALGNPSVRKKYVEALLCKGAKFETLVHPSAYIGRNVVIGQGCVVMQRTVLTAGLKVDDFVNIGVGTTLSHGNYIGEFSQFATNCSIAGEVKIGKFVECGSSVTVIPHISVGDYALLCAGAVIFKDVKSFEKVIGNPGRAIGRTDQR